MVCSMPINYSNKLILIMLGRLVMNFTKLNQKTLIQIVSVMLISTISGIAFAGPIITEWNYSTDATFTDSGFSGTSGTQTASAYELS